VSSSDVAGPPGRRSSGSGRARPGIPILRGPRSPTSSAGPHVRPRAELSGVSPRAVP
jgi:hypothetical protein